MVGTLQYAWTGNWPDRRAPEIGAIRVEGAEEGGYIKSGQRYRASVRAADPERDALSYRWELWRESTAVSQGGDREERPEDLSALLDTPQGEAVEWMAPPTEGAYRLYVYVLDGEGHAATANLPLYVRPKE